MNSFLFFLLLLWVNISGATTIAIIDTGFDLDHDFLRPKIFKKETDEENITALKDFENWDFHDNSHLKKPVIKDQSLLQEILLYRNLRAKGHTQGLSLSEFEWFEKRSSDKTFMNHVKNFKKHSHGTFVAGIALREGENIHIFPVRGLHIPVPVVAIEDNSTGSSEKLKGKNPEEKFQEEIKNSTNRVVKKFAKICRYLSLNKIDIVNASYGITYKNISSKFREKYKEITGREIEETHLQHVVKEYFEKLLSRTSKIITKYPKMLFIFSAGNSGLDNDLYPHYPSKIRLPNTLTIGAMNGEYLATFSNFGATHVDIGAPGVAILSLVPKIYSEDGKEIYSPSSGTSMAAPYVSNLAAQLLNINPKLTPPDLKKIILETGNVKEHLQARMVSAAIVDNQKAIKAALLSKDMSLDASIALATSGLIPLEDSISIGQPPAIAAEALQQKVFDAVPKKITQGEIEEIQSTSEESSSLQDVKTDTPDNSIRPSSTAPVDQGTPSDQGPSSQSAEQSLPPSGDSKPSSSQSSLQLQKNQDSLNVPSSP